METDHYKIEHKTYMFFCFVWDRYHLYKLEMFEFDGNFLEEWGYRRSFKTLAEAEADIERRKKRRQDKLDRVRYYK